MNYHKLHVTACLLHASEIKKINETQEFGTRASTRTVMRYLKNQMWLKRGCLPM